MSIVEKSFEAGMACPLDGVRVIDMSRLVSGNMVSLQLADFGAEVIKIEDPTKGDPLRAWQTDGVSVHWKVYSRNKKSVALSLREARGRELLLDLAATAQVLIENFRPGTMEKLGYGWDTLHPRYPRLVYAAASGFGHSGPYSHYPAYDMVVQGLGGVMSITGHPGMPLTRIGTSIGDLGGGLFTAIALNAALLHRERTGEAQKVDVSLFDCQLALLENAIMRYTTTGEIPGPMGARHPSITPFEAFATGDGNIIIAAGNDGLFVKLAHALCRPEWADNPIYKTNALRNQHQEALKDAIESVLRQAGTDHWIEVLEAAGVPCGPVNNIAQALAHPQTAARNMLIAVEDPVIGPLQLAGNPMKLSAFDDPATRAPAPELDADRDGILRELGL